MASWPLTSRFYVKQDFKSLKVSCLYLIVQAIRSLFTSKFKNLDIRSIKFEPVESHKLSIPVTIPWFGLKLSYIGIWCANDLLDSACLRIDSPISTTCALQSRSYIIIWHPGIFMLTQMIIFQLTLLDGMIFVGEIGGKNSHVSLSLLL